MVSELLAQKREDDQYMSTYTEVRCDICGMTMQITETLRVNDLRKHIARAGWLATKSLHKCDKCCKDVI